MTKTFTPSALDRITLISRLSEARARLESLAATLPADGWVGPYAPVLNPPVWEYGHIVWFQELWCLRRKPGRSPHDSPLLAPLAPARMQWADWRYNSSYIPHRARWEAPLPTPDETRAYGREVADAVAEQLARDGDTDLPYYAELSLHHESMHTEAWWMMWQWKGARPPRVPELPALPAGHGLQFEPGTVTLGAAPDAGFRFDNEKWSHGVGIDGFDIDSRPVTNAEFAEFIDAGGYADPAYWPGEASEWRRHSAGGQPLYWRKTEGAWQVRRFDRWIPLPEREPIIHVSRHEAQAYAAWRGRRLPHAAEWVHASNDPGFLFGRCWEWTSDAFAPYPGFSPDPYADYSAPWFHSHYEVRGGGCWVTDAALARPTYRNFFMPDRQDPFIGFRTAGLKRNR